MERECSVRIVRGKPDTTGRDWTRTYIHPVPGQVYRNRNGQDYRCFAALSGHDAIMERVTDGWTLTAHGVQPYQDGRIEWNYSTGGRWKKSFLADGDAVFTPAQKQQLRDILEAALWGQCPISPYCPFSCLKPVERILAHIETEVARELRAREQREQSSAADQTAVLLQHIREHDGRGGEG